MFRAGFDWGPWETSRVKGLEGNPEFNRAGQGASPVGHGCGHQRRMRSARPGGGPGLRIKGRRNCTRRAVPSGMGTTRTVGRQPGGRLARQTGLPPGDKEPAQPKNGLGA